MRNFVWSLLLVVLGCMETSEPKSEPIEVVSDHIIGGKPDKGHPAVGALLMKDGSLCTGTVISKRAVLTAAHCVADTEAEYFMLGRDAFEDSEGVSVAKTIVHPEYSTHEENGVAIAWHDLAVVRLADDVDVKPMNISDSPPKEKDKITFVGFGQISVDGEEYGKKFKVSTNISEVWSHGFWNFTDPKHPKNTCFGDSGGPALIKRGQEEQIIGIVSSGDPSCSESGYSIRVDTEIDFIFKAVTSSCGDRVCDPQEKDTCPEDCNNPCDLIGYLGCCEGEMVIWCEDGKPMQIDCISNLHCGYDPVSHLYDCGTAGNDDPEGNGKSCTARLLNKGS